MKSFFHLIILALTIVLLNHKANAFHSVRKNASRNEINNRFEIVKQKADSLVIAFYGKENFNRYIRLDYDASLFNFIPYNYYKIKPFSFKDSLTELPGWFDFKYIFLPPLDKPACYIAFRLDSVGNAFSKLKDCNYLHSSTFYGLQKNVNFKKLISQSKAISVARKNGMTKKIAGKPIIDWYDTDRTKTFGFDSTKLLTDLYWGRWVWCVAEKGTGIDQIGCVHYSGNRAYYIDAFTGEFIKYDNYY